MQIKLPHQGSADDGVRQIKHLLEEHHAEIGKQASDVELRWEGYVLHFAFTAQGTHITGTLTVRDKEYDLYAKLPLTLRLFEGKIERMIEAEIAKQINR